MWTFVLWVCASISFVMSLALCLCWRKKAPKNELLGLDGMVTQKNPDENVNHLPSAAPCVTDNTTVTTATASSAEVIDSNKRNVVSTNTRRSLPDIPAEQGDAPINWEPNCDNSSEHYATVAKRHTIHNGVEPRQSISQHSSISQADDAYEQVKYDKIKSKENPYAQLQPTTSRQAILEENKLIVEERLSLLRPDGSSTSSEPSAPPRSRRSSGHSSIGIDIPAASAVAGGIAASPELPYMTPPVTQPNFSGDSQDSSKGYTRISVREPLPILVPQRIESCRKLEPDQHYSTVSDDSDDVYTTIQDPNNQIYTSESETYARIPPHPITVEAEVNAPASGVQDDNDEFYESAPQPLLPNVKQGSSYTHSRQASSSSSIANIGSPKPEKRQANSPLPPPPTATTSFDFHLDKRNLDDLYAKVHKNKKRDDSDDEKTPEKGKKNLDSISRKSISSCSSLDDKRQESPLFDRKFNSGSSYKRREHNYETLRKSPKGVNEVSAQEEPGYASINNGPESITSSDPGYEVLKRNLPSECDPNYEELRHRSSNASDCAGYSKINYATKLNKSEDKSSSQGSTSLDEPNYESMPSESLSSDHNYAALKSTDSESDPNYESVRDIEDPPYERLDDSKTESDLGGSARGYEDIDTSESSNGEVVKLAPPYEQLNNDTDFEVPGYERIQRPSTARSTESTTGGLSKSKAVQANGLLEEDAIFQV